MANSEEPEFELPEALIDELKRSDRAPDVITARVDRTLAGLALAHFKAPTRRPRQRHFAWGAAACLMLAIALTTILNTGERNAGPYADIDGSGQIDIADVLALARSQPGIPASELHAFAFRVVALDQGGPR